MRLTIDSCPHTQEAISALLLFLSEPTHASAVRDIAQRFTKISQLLSNGHLMAVRAASMDDGAAWLKSVAAHLSVVETRLTFEWHGLKTARAADGVRRYALDGAATLLIGFLQSVEPAKRRELTGHHKAVENLKTRLAIAGLQADEIEVAMASSAESAPSRQRAIEASIAECAQQLAALNAYLADPLRSVSSLGQDLLDQLAVQQPQRVAAHA